MYFEIKLRVLGKDILFLGVNYEGNQSTKYVFWKVIL